MPKPVDKSDRSLGIQTSRCIRVKALDFDAARQQTAEDYQPTPPEILDDIFIDLDITHERFTFVDLGSGKGRVVLLASAWPFARIEGVELSRRLHTQALQNYERFDPPWRVRSPITFCHADAAAYAFPNEPLVVFMYNPFKGPVIRSVLQNLQRSFETNPRPIYVVYFEPVFVSLLAGCWWLEPHTASDRWCVYATKP